MSNPSKRKCAVMECDRPRSAREWCSSHYMNWWRRGDPLAFAVDASDMERFWAKFVVSGSGCWLWTVSKASGGYGKFAARGVNWKAHRYAYQHLVGPVPDGLDLDHLCRVRHCVNPMHLEPVTRSENLRRKTDKTSLEQRQEIACRYPTESAASLAAEFGVTRERIYQIGKAA